MRLDLPPFLVPLRVSGFSPCQLAASGRPVVRKILVAITPTIVTAVVAILLLPVMVSAAEDLTELVKKLRPTVVAIYTYDADGNQTGQGTGFFVSSNGEILTNYHVIQGAHSAEIKTSTEQVFKLKGVIAEDKANDLARMVVDTTSPVSATPRPIDEQKAREFFRKAKTEGLTKEQAIQYVEAHLSDFEESSPNDEKAVLTFPSISFSASTPEPGGRIFVIGNPLGLEASVSDGIVSAVRDIPDFGKTLQITAPVSPGSSGSPVFNLKGEVVGIAAAIVLDAQNVNFAVPVAVAGEMKPHKLTTLAELTEADDRAWLFTAEGRLWLGNYYVESGQYSKAVETFKQAILLEPNSVEAHYNLGVSYINLGRYSKAVHTLTEVIRMKPDLAAAHNNLGVAYCEMERYSESVESYRKAIHLAPDWAKPHYNLGIVYSILGVPPEAAKAFAEAIRLKPDWAEAHYNLGGVYVKAENWSEAAREYKETTKLRPDWGEAHRGLGVCYLSLGRFPEALSACKQAEKIEPDSAEAHCCLGMAYLSLNDRGSALEEYRILKELDREMANTLFSLLGQ